MVKRWRGVVLTAERKRKEWMRTKRSHTVITVIHRSHEPTWCDWSWRFLLRRPNALEPTLVGIKLRLPTPPERLRKSASRCVTHVAVLHARLCAVTLLQDTTHHITSQVWNNLKLHQFKTVQKPTFRGDVRGLTCRNLADFHLYLWSHCILTYITTEV